jgi:hypothetical protein
MIISKKGLGIKGIWLCCSVTGQAGAPKNVVQVLHNWKSDNPKTETTLDMTSVRIKCWLYIQELKATVTVLSKQ